jgi:muramoyltetrapeptide carboxypeptidase
MRLLDLLDYALIQKHPKIFVGYSDITALHTAIGQRAGLVTFHGPMAASDMGRDKPSYTAECLWQALTSSEPLGPIFNPPSALPPEFLIPGKAEGCLTGGNLSLIAATLGTSYEMDTNGKILCLEDIDEAPYRIDRMLTQLLLAGKLQAAAGIVCDVFNGCNDEEDPGFTITEVLKDRLGKLNKPVLINLYFGHTALKTTLPLGVKAKLNDKKGLVILEAAATE